MENYAYSTMDGGSIYETIIDVNDPLTYVSMSLRARSYASYPLGSQLASGHKRAVFSPTVRFDVHFYTLVFGHALSRHHHRHVSPTKKTHRGVC